jgi:hypothetical protein
MVIHHALAVSKTYGNKIMGGPQMTVHYLDAAQYNRIAARNGWTLLAGVDVPATDAASPSSANGAGPSAAAAVPPAYTPTAMPINTMAGPSGSSGATAGPSTSAPPPTISGATSGTSGAGMTASGLHPDAAGDTPRSAAAAAHPPHIKKFLAFATIMGLPEGPMGE